MKKCTLITGISIKYKIIVPVVIMLLLSSAAAALIVYHSISSADEQEVQREMKGLYTGIFQRISEAETAAGMIAENLASNNDVQFSVALQDAGLLEQNTRPLIRSLEQGSFLQGYFDFTNAQGTVIYASNAEWLKGKKLADYRPLLRRVMQEQKKASGLEMGPDGLYVRSIAPVIYNGEFAGAVEFNCSLKSIFSKIRGGAENVNIGIMLPADMASGLHSSEGFLPVGNMRLACYTDAAPFRLLSAIHGVSDGPQRVRKGNIIFSLFPMKLAANSHSVTGVLAYDSTVRSEAVMGAMKKLGLSLGISTMLVALLMALFLSRIIAPLQHVVSGMKSLSRGQFTSVAPRVSCDEFGELARLNNNILFSFGRLVSTLQDDARNLTHAAGYIKSSGRQFQEGIVSLDSESDILAAKAASVSETLQQTSRSMEDLAAASTEIAGSVATSAASAGEALEMSLNANSVIDSLGESSQKIGEIVKVINAVAEQTNLLALNATIEAARAGEAGKGFAVVAGEVKELARQTGRATDEIAQMVRAIQADTARAVEVVEEIGVKISAVTDMTNTIASATEEQTATISEISGTLESGMQEVVNLADLAETLKNETVRFSESVVSATNSQEAIVELADELQTVARYFNVSPDAVKTAGHDADDKVRLMSATLKHFRWKQALTLAILEGRPVSIEIDPDRCDLGRFVRSRLEVAPSRERDIMEQIAGKHHRLHELGHAVLDHLEAGRQEEARRLFKHELAPLFQDMLELLDLAKQLTMGRAAAA